ncbi:MAG: CheB methylesterase domain-containing protein, partial [Acidimicrobiales bacterium]
MTRRMAAVFHRAMARKAVRDVLDAIPDVELLSMPPKVALIAHTALSEADLLLVCDEVEDLELAVEHAAARPDLELVVLAKDAAATRKRIGSNGRVIPRPPDGQLAAAFSQILGPAPSARTAPATTKTTAARSATRRSAQPPKSRDLLVVGSSTGGPEALTKVLSSLPQWFPVPVLVCQHMPANFTGLLARKLDAASELRVREALKPSLPIAGDVLIAPGDRHLIVKDASGAVELSTAPPRNSCQPSVDHLFESAAQHFAGRVVAVMLTGMGNDGLEGTRRLAAAGAHVIAQDEATSVVWGMPGAIAPADLA